MLMMTPVRCWRITGSACFTAMIVPRRLIVAMRSKASSVISVVGASLTKILTHTLLCRISMRSQRLSAVPIIATRVCSFVTSASQAAASPPSLAMIATVSSAEARLRSTARTLAPSWAKRMAVARPLPMPSPGPWPAPTTMAIFPSRRMTDSSVRREREFFEVMAVIRLDIDVERRQQADHAAIEGDRDHEIGEALLAQFVPEAGEGRIIDQASLGHLAGRFEYRLGEWLEPARASLGLVDHRADIGVAHAEVAADLDVMRILIGRAREISDLQNCQLSQPRIEPAGAADELAETAEGARGIGAVHQRAHQVDRAIEQIPLLRG